jgi:hypothetical protein
MAGQTTKEPASCRVARYKYRKQTFGLTSSPFMHSEKIVQRSELLCEMFTGSFFVTILAMLLEHAIIAMHVQTDVHVSQSKYKASVIYLLLKNCH